MDILEDIVNQCPTVAQGPSGQVFMMLINALVSAKCQLGDTSKYPHDYADSLQDDDEFDFIIVGAGSAGSRLASRLSEISKWKILLIEAGGYPSGTSEIPLMASTLRDTEEDWAYKMEPTKNLCKGLKDRICPCPRGKGLGGSSLINAMMYVRSTREDHDEWVNLGNHGWDYDSVAELYRIIEDVKTKDHAYGKNGDLKISSNLMTSSFQKSTPDIYQELGFGEYSINKPTGFNLGLNTIADGTRQNTAKAFLVKTKDRSNLFVALHSQVGKLLFNLSKTKVIGVEVKINKQIFKIRAKKEVILSSGSINSPQILLNSGIGPKKHLSELGIEVVRDLQVGENFQDHVLFPMFLFDIKASDLSAQPSVTELDNLYQYFIHKTGPLAGLEYKLTGYVSTNNITYNSNIQFIHLVFPQKSDGLFTYLKEFQATEHIKKIVATHNQKLPIATIMMTLLHPKSRGRVKLQSNDPYTPPLIKPNFLSDQHNEDLKTLLNAIKIAKQMITTKALAKYSPQLFDLQIPDCRKCRYDSTEYWECLIKNLGQTLYHPVGTCKMGPSSDSTAVVDPELRVHNIRGIRVIDGSIMPTVTSGNTNAPIIMIAEKGFRLLRKEWLLHQN